MRVYKIEALGTKTKWVGTQAEAANIRKQFVDAGRKRAELTTSEVNVPTDKAGLLAFLNENASG